MAVPNKTTMPRAPFLGGPSDIDTTVTDNSDLADATKQPVTFMSYNPTGADTVKCHWVCEVAIEHEVDYCALQEHLKTVTSTEQWFRKKFGNYHTYVVPAYRQPGVDSGRGIGGLAQLSLRTSAVPRAQMASKSQRLQDQLLTFPTCTVLWMNGYLLCDPQLQTFDDTELVSTLAEVETLVTANSDCEVVCAADLNYDMH